MENRKYKNMSFPQVVGGNLPLSKLLLKKEKQLYFMQKVEDPQVLAGRANLGMTPNFTSGLHPTYNGAPAPRHSVRFLYGIWARTSAFTLIELLVVVLIIGILAAVALPQYKVAVAKSRFVQLQVIADGLKKAESVYFMTNGKYTQDFSELDISPELNTAGNVAKAGEASCYANEDGMFYCFYGGGFAGTSPVPVYVSSWGQERAHCRAYAGFQNKVCKSLSKENKNCEPSADSYCAYRL